MMRLNDDERNRSAPLHRERTKATALATRGAGDARCHEEEHGEDT